jgi:hypothetical protein
VVRYVRSEPEPDVNNGPVLTVVGSTFEELVWKADAHVLLKLYAPWCVSRMSECMCVGPRVKCHRAGERGFRKWQRLSDTSSIAMC